VNLFVSHICAVIAVTGFAIHTVIGVTKFANVAKQTSAGASSSSAAIFTLLAHAPEVRLRVHFEEEGGYGDLHYKMSAFEA
jgi:hypothetical protein